MASEERPRAVVAALVANLGIAVAKFVAFVFTRSSSMLAEGIHSLADTGNQVLLLVGHRRGNKAADELHLGPERILVAARVQLSEGLDTDGVARVLDEVEARITDRLDRDCVIYLEPERTNGAGASDSGSAAAPDADGAVNDGDGSVGT
jgi:divalent metal cation (Fe/Co/Zn/Cd) transporter